MSKTDTKITRKGLIDALNEDLSREYQAIISYVNYSQLLKGAAYMKIADELAIHATEELDHALKIANHVDYLGGMPSVTPKPVKTSEKAEDMLKFDRNIWHISHEGGELEDPANGAPDGIWMLTKSPKEAPDKAVDVTIGFEKSRPVSVNGKRALSAVVK